MAGISVEGPSGGRRSVDSEINMIPMIDLFVCCISFLLITAVWSHMARLETTAEVPGVRDVDPPPVEKKLHVEMKGNDAFRLVWRVGPTVVESLEVPRHAVDADGTPRFGDLSRAIADAWRANGSHRDSADAKRDVAVVHADDRAPFGDLVGVLDAIRAPKRELAGGSVPAFEITFASDSPASGGG